MTPDENKHGWLPIETAPKDGKPFLAIGRRYDWPEVVKWEDYDAELAEEIGEPGYFTFAEALLADASDFPDDLTHWQPLPKPPVSP
jgi:hypothetical protein